MVATMGPDRERVSVDSMPNADMPSSPPSSLSFSIFVPGDGVLSCYAHAIGFFGRTAISLCTRWPPCGMTLTSLCNRFVPDAVLQEWSEPAVRIVERAEKKPRGPLRQRPEAIRV